MTDVSASSAASASSPIARNTIVAPNSAASIITPMMLFALTSRSSRMMVTLLLNFPAVFTISAAGRACIPSLLTIFTSRSGIRSAPSRERTQRELPERSAIPPPARADQSVADTSQRSGERRPKSLDSYRIHPAELCARQRADRDSRQIGVGIEVARFARQCRTIGLSVQPSGKKTQRRLHHETDAGTEQRLVVPGSLQR